MDDIGNIKGIRILVVDDSRTMRQVMARMIKQLGFQNVEIADGAEDALERVRESGYDLVISDWHMTPVSGLDLLKEIRADSRTEKVPFIMVTAEQHDEKAADAMAAGASDYLIKPYGEDAIRSKIVAVMGAG